MVRVFGNGQAQDFSVADQGSTPIANIYTVYISYNIWYILYVS